MLVVIACINKKLSNCSHLDEIEKKELNLLKTVIYARFSTEKQAKEGYLISEKKT